MEWLGVGVQTTGLAIWIYGLTQTGSATPRTDTLTFDQPKAHRIRRPARRAALTTAVGVALFAGGAIMTLHD